MNQTQGLLGRIVSANHSDYLEPKAKLAMSLIRQRHLEISNLEILSYSQMAHGIVAIQDPITIPYSICALLFDG